MSNHQNQPRIKGLPASLNGIVIALPVILGYLPVGFAYGVLAEKAGLSAVNTLLMSIVVFAGSAQLIAVGLFSAGIEPLTIILTTFVVNLRHMLMSAALSPYLQSWRKSELAWFAYELTDETFALHATRLPEDGVSRTETFAINAAAQAAWILGTLLGVVGGRLVTDIEPLALDYALPAMFIALLVMQLNRKTEVAVAVVSGLCSVGLYLAGWDQWHVIMATLVGATFGVVVEKWIR